MGLSCWIAHKSVWSPNYIATVFGDRTLTYGEFERWVAHLSGYLVRELDTSEGDRIAYLGRNSDLIPALFFACMRVGAIFVPLNSRMTGKQLGVMIANAEPHYLFAGPDFTEVANSCTKDSATKVIPFGAAQAGTERINLFDDVGQIELIECDPNRDQNIPALIAYTSGTTGTPKGAVFTQDAITFSAINSNNCWSMRASEHVLTFLPMFHVGGLMIQSLPAFHMGARVTIFEEFDAGEVLRCIEKERVTLMLCPPHFSRALFQHPAWATTTLDSLRGVVIGSTFVPPEVMQTWIDRGVPTQHNYGMTEVSHILGTPYSEHKRKAHTAGLGMLYSQARIMDENMNRLPPGEVGEIMLRGRSIFSGYWRNPEADRDSFKDGWFRTGDIAYTDDEGYFHIVDRKKSIVIVGSSNVYPSDLEKVLEECPEVAEAAVVGCPDPETGEAIVACIQPRDRHWCDEAMVRSLFKGRLAPYQHPKHVLFMQELPRTSLGKVERVALAETVSERLGLA